MTDLDLTDLDTFANGFPHAAFATHRAEAPVWWHAPTRHTPGGVGFWSVASHAATLTVLRDADTFSSEHGGTMLQDVPASGLVLNMMDDPRHHRIRRLVNKGLTPRVIALLADELARRTRTLLDALPDGESVDFLGAVAAEIPMQTICAMLDVAEQFVAIGLGDAEHRADRLHRDLGRHRAQEVDALAVGQRVEQRPCPAGEFVRKQGDHAGREALVDQTTDPVVPRIVHHVEHEPGRGDVLEHRPAVLGRERVRVAQHGQRRGVRRHRPESDPAGRVPGRGVPPHGRLGAVRRERGMRETVREGVEIGQVEIGHGHEEPPYARQWVDGSVSDRLMGQSVRVPYCAGVRGPTPAPAATPAPARRRHRVDRDRHRCRARRGPRVPVRMSLSEVGARVGGAA